MDPEGRLLLLTGATRRYHHGALGDDLEAGAVTLAHTAPAVAAALTIPIAAPIVAEAAGWSSHALGARNLDQAMAGDFDGDGRAELLAPSQDRTRLGGIRRTQAGAEVAWTVPLGGRRAGWGQ